MNFYILSNQQEILQCSLLQQRLNLLRRIDWKLVRYISTCLEDRLFEVVLRNFNLEVSEYSPNFPGLAEYNNAILCKL